jgi:hypothetical protein
MWTTAYATQIVKINGFPVNSVLVTAQPFASTSKMSMKMAYVSKQTHQHIRSLFLQSTIPPPNQFYEVKIIYSGCNIHHVPKSCKAWMPNSVDGKLYDVDYIGKHSCQFETHTASEQPRENVSLTQYGMYLEGKQDQIAHEECYVDFHRVLEEPIMQTVKLKSNQEYFILILRNHKVLSGPY